MRSYLDGNPFDEKMYTYIANLLTKGFVFGITFLQFTLSKTQFYQ